MRLGAEPRTPPAAYCGCRQRTYYLATLLRYKPAVCELLRFLTADRPEPSTRSLRPRR